MRSPSIRSFDSDKTLVNTSPLSNWSGRTLVGSSPTHVDEKSSDILHASNQKKLARQVRTWIHILHFAYIMDHSFLGLPFGMSSLIGFFPEVGDFLVAFASCILAALIEDHLLATIQNMDSKQTKELWRALRWQLIKQGLVLAIPFVGSPIVYFKKFNMKMVKHASKILVSHLREAPAVANKMGIYVVDPRNQLYELEVGEYPKIRKYISGLREQGLSKDAAYADLNGLVLHIHAERAKHKNAHHSGEAV